MTKDRAALDAAAARSRRAAVAFAEHPVNHMLRAAFAESDDAGHLATVAEHVLGDDAWVTALLAPLLAEVRAEPLFEPPLVVSRDAARFSVVLFDQPTISITATILSADALAAAGAARHVTMSGRLSVIRYVRAGGARRRLWEADAAGEDFRAAAAAPCRALGERVLADGMLVRLDGRTQGQMLAGATADVVTLTATIRTGASAYVREYAAADGALLRCAMLDERPARTQMLLAYLRLAGRADAGACFAEATRDAAFFLRWPAMREWLALDPAAAVPRLREMAVADPHGEVRAAASATLAAITARPGAMACPA